MLPPTASLFFGLGEETIERVYGTPRRELRKLAFLGDARLQLEATEFVTTRWPHESVGGWSTLRSYLVNNEKLSQYLKLFPDVAHRRSQASNAASEGTIFEALVQVAHEASPAHMARNLHALFHAAFCEGLSGETSYAPWT